MVVVGLLGHADGLRECLLIAFLTINLPSAYQQLQAAFP
jgi:hypothetical protein